MTAVNVVLRPDKAILMTDAAFYDAWGNILGFGMKAFPIPNLKAAIAVRGLQAIVPTLGLEMSIRYSDFDDMADRLADDMVEWYAANEEALRATGLPTFELNIVGWSDREKRPRHFAWTNHAEADAEEFCRLTETIDDVGNYSFSPPVSREEWDVRLPSQGIYMGKPTFARNFDPVRDGLPLMEAQRRTFDTIKDNPDAEPLSIVGGFACVTEIGASGIEMKVVHTWPDRVGEPVLPTPWVADRAVPITTSGKVIGDSFAQFPAKRTPPAGLNRQQRRAWERKHGAAA